MKMQVIETTFTHPFVGRLIDSLSAEEKSEVWREDYMIVSEPLGRVRQSDGRYALHLQRVEKLVKTAA